MPEHAVRYLSPDHPQLAITVAQRISAKADKLAAEIAGGYCSDWADYKNKVGRLQAMREDMIECAEVERELSNPR